MGKKAGWIKTSQFTETLDPALMKQIEDFPDIQDQSSDFLEQQTWPEHKDIKFLLNNLIEKKKGVILTPQEREILIKTIEEKNRKEGLKNIGLKSLDTIINNYLESLHNEPTQPNKPLPKKLSPDQKELLELLG